jgi:hypothetical protein
MIILINLDQSKKNTPTIFPQHFPHHFVPTVPKAFHLSPQVVDIQPPEGNSEPSVKASGKMTLDDGASASMTSRMGYKKRWKMAIGIVDLSI